MNLCTSLSSTTLQEIRDDFARAIARGTDLAEIRLDYLKPEEMQRVHELEPWLKKNAEKLIITCRPPDEGGHFEGDQQERVTTLMWASGFRPRFIDFEFEQYARSKDAAEKVTMMASPSREDQLARIMLSEHHVTGRPTKLNNKFLQLSETPVEAIKLVWPARDARDNFEALDLMKSAVKPTTTFCTGAAGLPSRILSKKFGAAVTYCALGEGEETAPGQPTLDEMVEMYRWKSIDRQTAVYGLIGDPVEHSLGPAVHNAAFGHEKINAVYVPFRLPADGHNFADFIKAVADRSWLNIRGFSVTSPHKQHAWILTQDDLDPVTLRLESINTLTFGDDNVYGSNTDYQAAIEWLKGGLACDLPDFADMRFDVLGAGGLARSVVGALRLLRAQVTIYNRTPKKARALADAFNCQAEEYHEHTLLEGDVVINCTTVGLWPDIYKSPVRAEQLKAGCTVFDAIYSPAETQLLNSAKSRECRAIGGLDLFIKQAALQFSIWTGRVAPTDIMQAAAIERIRASS